MQQKEISAKTERQTDSLYDLTKLEDANWAGTTKSAKCSLFITEGDSAKALVIAGLDVIGRDCYGVFPIRGKPINVCEMSEEKAMKNKEISNLIRILGLRFGADYSNLEERNKLRYGNIIIFADQDEDGSHIKGLLINFLHRFWPELIREGFLQSFATPLLKLGVIYIYIYIIRARRGAEVQSFYSLTDFKKWKEECIDTEKFSIKYYKGLGVKISRTTDYRVRYQIKMPTYVFAIFLWFF
uniref:DNA topoisomerase (ATP-hydrolyzing) n=1 Tax=Heterorhabditis bacteriophora TaxID=37862 RepID=A0A1I7XHI5_HETBA